MYWHHTFPVGDIAWISLNGRDQSFEVVCEAFVESGLRPVDAEIPIAGTLKETGVLFKGSAGDSSLYSWLIECLSSIQA